jgi:hypothetical protein
METGVGVTLQLTHHYPVRRGIAELRLTSKAY